jgi:hypothetical protein
LAIGRLAAIPTRGIDDWPAAPIARGRPRSRPTISSAARRCATAAAPPAIAAQIEATEAELAAGEDAEFMKAKIATARFYADHILTRTAGRREAIVEGFAGVTEMAIEAY